ncbi:hypothetical protein B0T20DRAFT_389090 [Sordaria brevicollis]|uniref:Uncharacterized protein n=1 Tax=Sordaria brevicollis TaxID=83679 RepID=A0AAE0PNU7_SORBR|nr:hypothetical protein B0T20DRAFT_389090 [Sordaria brevicollis]
MRLIAILSLLVLLAATSPISHPGKLNGGPAVISKRFQAGVPWIWGGGPPPAEFEQFEDGADQITPTDPNPDATTVVNKRVAGPWIWKPDDKKSTTRSTASDSGNSEAGINKRFDLGPFKWNPLKENFEDDKATATGAVVDGNAAIKKRIDAGNFWAWDSKDFEASQNSADDASDNTGGAEGEQK